MAESRYDSTGVTGCRNPFDILYLLPSGYTTCCQSWLDQSHWFMKSFADPWHIWNSEQFSSLRRKVLANDWSACKNCVRLIHGDIPECISNDAMPWLERGPRHIIICNDLACNLYCWSCRRYPIGVTEGSEKRELQMLRILNEFLPTCRVVSLLQSGEVFASKMHLRWLDSLNISKYPDLKIKLTTNGTLISDKWEVIRNAWPVIKSISMSVDAATPRTYHRVRLGGRWGDALGGLAFAAKLRRDGDIDRLQINMCVQAANFRDIPAVTSLGRGLRVDKIKFTLLRKWWQTDEQYAKANVASSDHKDNAEFLEICNYECLISEIIDARQLTACVNLA